jgi:hypothetical protein
MVKEQYQLNPEIFAQEVGQLLARPEQLQQLGATLANYFNVKESLTAIVDILLDVKR